MRILSVIYEYPPLGGGGGVVAAALNAALVERGHSVDVITSAFGDLPGEERLDGVAVHRAACWRRYRHYSTAAELATTLLPSYRLAVRLIRRNPPQLIHAHFALPSGLVARALAKRFGIPYVITTHGSDVPGYNPDRFEHLHHLLQPLWRRVLHDAAAITSPSQFLADLIRHSDSLPIQIIPNGYSPQASVQAPRRKLVLAVARLFPRKGLQYFVEAVAGLPSGWEFVVAGDGPYLPVLKEHAARAGAGIHFIGFADRSTLARLYAQARVFVFPSLRENFPMVLLEAMDVGCAVITTDAAGCAEVIGDAGLVVPKGNSQALHAALAALLDDDGKCETLAARALERVEQFRWPVIAAAYESCFEAVLRPAIEPLPAAAALLAASAPVLPASSSPGTP